ncbi:MAG: four-carbon acid sugar kinase family protein, partial [Candidatus Bathyarchaeia archaeon]
MLAGAVADDDTGMADLCGMFSKHGVNTVMFFEGQPRSILEKYSEWVDVVAIGTRARSIDPNEAYMKTREAL